MRPPYETDDDRRIEIEIIEKFCKTRMWVYSKLPLAYNIDFGLMEAGNGNRTVAWAETKRRKNAFDRYSSVFLSMHKVFAARLFNHYTRLPCFFVVQFDDCLAFADMVPRRTVILGGRRDRGDPQDSDEPLALVRMNEFTKIGDGNADEGTSGFNSGP